MMQFTAGQIAAVVGGNIEGDANTVINSFAKIEEAKEGDISFLAYAKYAGYLYTTTASVIILNQDFELKQPVSPVLIRVPDAYAAFVTLLTKYQEMRSASLTGIEQPSFVADNASLGSDVYIGAFSYIGKNVTVGNHTKIYPNCFIGENVRIGNNCIIHPGVKIYHDCVIQDHVVVHAGTVIGGDGFGYTPGPDGNLIKVPQIGNVIIENNVEIGCITAIDRATMGSTIIKAGTKLDNLVQIAHNVVIGQSSVIAGQSGIGGSTRIGKGVQIGGQTAVVEHISIADGSRIGAKSKVTKAVKIPNSNINGSPAFEYSRSSRSQAVYKNLPELEQRVKTLEENARKQQGN
jgi:UDP-3-O-[3-hydroxymyristoyl] glucosamine N-acyltransferase